MFRPKWRNLRLFRGRDSGQTMVETALCASLFILVLFASLDVAWYFYAKATLQNAVRQAARYAITGNCNSGSCGTTGSGGTTDNNRIDTINSTIQYYQFNIIPTSITISCTPAETGGCGSQYGSGTNNAGGPGDFVTISASYNYAPIVLWRWPGTFSFTVSSSFKNESFSPYPSGG